MCERKVKFLSVKDLQTYYLGVEIVNCERLQKTIRLSFEEIGISDHLSRKIFGGKNDPVF